MDGLKSVHDDLLPNYGRRLEPHLKNLVVPDTFFMKSKVVSLIVKFQLLSQNFVLDFIFSEVCETERKLQKSEEHVKATCPFSPAGAVEASLHVSENS